MKKTFLVSVFLSLAVCLYSCGTSTDKERELLEREKALLEKEKGGTGKTRKKPVSSNKPVAEFKVLNELMQLNKEGCRIVNFRTMDFGSLWNIEVGFNNVTRFKMDVVKVKVYYYLANGQTYKTEIVTFVDVQPYTEEKVFAPKSDRGRKLGCEILKVESSQLKQYAETHEMPK